MPMIPCLCKVFLVTQYSVHLFILIALNTFCDSAYLRLTFTLLFHADSVLYVLGGYSGQDCLKVSFIFLSVRYLLFSVNVDGLCSIHLVFSTSVFIIEAQ